MNLFFWLLIGYFVWKKLKPYLEDGARQGASSEESRREFLDAIVGMSARLAKADGRVSEGEVNVASEFLRSLTRSGSEYQWCVARFNRYVKNADRAAESFAYQLRAVASKEARELVYELMWSIAASDGSIHPNEDALLSLFAGALGLGSAAYIYNRRRFVYADYSRSRESAHEPRQSELERAYAKLGCSPDDSDAKIKTAYRKLAMKYHPDRLRSEGLSEAMLEQATKSMAEINAAWDLVKSSRGM